MYIVGVSLILYISEQYFMVKYQCVYSFTCWWMFQNVDAMNTHAQAFVLTCFISLG